MATRITTKVTRTLPCVYLCCNCQKANLGKVSFSAEASSRAALSRSSTTRLADERKEYATNAVNAKQEKIIPAFNRGSYGMTTRTAVCSSCGEKQPWASPASWISFAAAALPGLALLVYAFATATRLEFSLIIGGVMFCLILAGLLMPLMERIVNAIATASAHSKLASAPSPYCAPLLFDPAAPVPAGDVNDPRLAIIRKANEAQNQ